jgi:quercetin dioxygenase-like cupin family protein
MKHLEAGGSMMSEPTEVFGEIEAEARGLLYGAMVFTVKPGCTTSPHHHASEETWMVQEGCGRAKVRDQDIGLIPGTRLSVPSGAVHSITNTSSEDLTVISFWWREVDRGE